jgi:hypothetical protein
MAKVIAKLPPLTSRLRSALAEGLATAGIKAQIEIESIRGTKLQRVTILSKGFEKLRPSERQDLVWRILTPDLTREDQLQISAIYTFAPSELRGE